MTLRDLIILFLLSLFGVSVSAQTFSHDRSVQAWAEVQANPAQITLRWQNYSTANGYQIYRKLRTGNSWGSL